MRISETLRFYLAPVAIALLGVLVVPERSGGADGPCDQAHCGHLPVQSMADSITVEAIGDVEVVFSHATDACSPDDIPDAPARAFRDAQNNVVLMAPHGAAAAIYRFVGQSLDSVRHSCDAVMRPGNNRDFDVSAYHEWIVAPYATDGVHVYAVIHNEWYPMLADPKCVWGWVNSLTVASSDDGGAHFVHPADYKIRVPAVPWRSSFTCTNRQPDDTKYGSFEPSNIIAKDGYYYSIFYYQRDPIAAPPEKGNVVGNCIMRTRDLSRGSAWEVWTSSGWQRASTTPDCDYISPQALHRAFIKSMSYSTYLNAYLGLVTSYANGEQSTGYTLSHDLMTWTTPVLLFQDRRLPQGDVAYPSLLDPADSTRNFERSGREPYLYLMNWNGKSLNRNLIRQKIRFSR